MEKKHNTKDSYQLNKFKIILENENKITERNKIFTLYNYFTLIDEKQENELTKLENNIYTINGRCLSEKQRIELEVKRIFEYIKNDSGIIEDYNEKRRLLKELIEIKRYIDNGIEDNKIVISFLKKKIITIQASLKLPITFYTEIIDTYNEILENKIIELDKNLMFENILSNQQLKKNLK